MDRQNSKFGPHNPAIALNDGFVDPSEPTPCQPTAILADDTCGRYRGAVHHAAVAALQEYDEGKVLAWIQLLRSLTPDFEHTTPSGNLSAQQIDAVATLRDCPDQTVITLLRNRRKGSSLQFPADQCNRLTTYFKKVQLTA